MTAYPETLRRLIESLSALPGVGRRGAERFAFFMLYEDREAAKRIASSINEILRKVVVCSRCHNIAESDPCWICADAKRRRDLLCLVEMPQDVMAIERSGIFNGLYFVLGTPSSQSDNIPPLSDLLRYARDEDVREVVVATSPTTKGDIIALEVKKLFENSNIKVSRIARGMPEGASVQFASPLVLRDAFRQRTEV